MLKEKFKGMVIGLLVGATVAGGVVFAKTGTVMLEATYSDIKIRVDGETINTSNNEPFIYDGTTYLPVRAVGEALGKEVGWDGVNKVVSIGADPDQENWMNQCKPYQYKNGEECLVDKNKFFTMSGDKYTNGFVLDAGTGAEALFNLNGRYNYVTFTVGHIDGSNNLNTNLNIYLDGKLSYTRELKYDDVAQTVRVPLNGALSMKIELESNTWGTKYGFAAGKFE